jgi:phosphatidylethanolamine-binding protein (PEBP) family uncharacterized protein
MLEKLPHALGAALKGVRAGLDEIAILDSAWTEASALTLDSPAIADGGVIPVRFTADGEGVSPPLAWSGLPPATVAVLLLVEDADSPTPEPLVHALALLNPSATDLHRGDLPEGALREGGPGVLANGKNSFLKAGWLPPDPPPGHGPHRYAFQLFALSDRPTLDDRPTRGEALKAIRGKVLAKGLLIGTYERK